MGTGPATVDDLLADARALGQPVTARAITDWISLGLLDHPTRRSAGRGQGSHPALFSPEQRQLFHLLLAQRQQGTPVRLLTTFPLAIWVYCGDTYVPLAQARLALRTWLKRHRFPSKQRARREAGALVRQLTHQQASPGDRDALRDLLTTVIWTGRVDDEDKLRRRLRRVIDPHNEGRVLGPPGATIDPERIVKIAVRRCRAATELLADRVPDSVFRDAQQGLCEHLSEYLLLQPQLAAQAGELSHLFQPPLSIDQLGNGVVLNLLLGIGHFLEQNAPPSPEDP